MDFPAARAILEAGIAARAFPGAVVEVGRASGVLWRGIFGTLTYGPGAAPVTSSTRFDLASLTKVIVTASLVMRDVAAGRFGLDTPLQDVLPAWAPRAAEDIRIEQLLDHSAGLPAHARLWHTATGRGAYLDAIRSIALERAPRTASVYSDLGFILLGLALEETGGASLDDQFAAFARDVEREHDWSLRRLTFGPVRPAADVAPTEVDPWRDRLLIGEVHDENAAAIGGVAGHAGLFGDAASVGAFARLVLATFAAPTALGMPDLMRRFARRTEVPGSSRALGWDTMVPTSSCGARMSSTAIGHTGFTGTSLWIDWERDTYVVLLTNRVHPTRENAAMTTIRPQLHDAVIAELFA